MAPATPPVAIMTVVAMGIGVAWAGEERKEDIVQRISPERIGAHVDTIRKALSLVGPGDETVREQIYSKCIDCLRQRNDTPFIHKWISKLASTILHCESHGSLVLLEDLARAKPLSQAENANRTQNFLSSARWIVRQVCRYFEIPQPSTSHRPIWPIPDDIPATRLVPIRKDYHEDIQKSPWHHILTKMADGFPDVPLKLDPKLQHGLTKGERIAMQNNDGIKMVEGLRYMPGGDKATRLRRTKVVDTVEEFFEIFKNKTNRKSSDLLNYEVAQIVRHKLQENERRMRRKLESSGMTAGPDWDWLPATKIEGDYKKDLRFIARREMFQPGHFYKKPESTQFPRYFARVVDKTPYTLFRKGAGLPLKPLWVTWMEDENLWGKYMKSFKNRQKALERFSKKNMGKAGIKAKKTKRKQKRRRL
ncbi:hypothetical protein AAMO2058_000908600 [Amorphochlora amoebiformis]